MKIAIGLGVVVALLVGLVLLLPFIVDLNKYQDQYRPLIEEALNRKVTLADIRLTIWPRLGARVAGSRLWRIRPLGWGRLPRSLRWMSASS